jgi:sensitive to high expression protein 9
LTEASISLARTAAREAKAAHDEAVLQRARSQREVNDLLSRKSSWSDDDVGRFTRLVRQDHLYEQAEARAKEAAIKAEDEVEREFTALMQAILNRYHEEQVWSDKIRSASTYGSLAVLGLNVLVFLMATIFVEPWKRKRLAATFGKKVDEMDARNTVVIGDGMTAIHQRLDRQEEAFAQLMAMAVQPPPIPIAASPEPAPEPAKPEETHEQILPIADPTSIASTRPWSWAWEDWRAKLTQPDTRDVLLAASSLAFVGGSMTGWIIRELRR